MTTEVKEPSVANDESVTEEKEEKYVSKAEFTRVLNKAISSHMERLSSKIPEMISSSIPKPVEAETDQQRIINEAVNKATQPYIKRLEAEQTKLAQIEHQRLIDEERSQVSKILEDSGVTGTAKKAAIAMLKDEGKIKRNAEGKVVFVTQQEGFDEESPLADALKGWLNTDEGKLFRPAKNVSGSGQSGTRGPGRPSKTTKEDAKQAAEDYIARAFGMKR